MAEWAAAAGWAGCTNADFEISRSRQLVILWPGGERPHRAFSLQSLEISPTAPVSAQNCRTLQGNFAAARPAAMEKSHSAWQPV